MASVLGPLMKDPGVDACTHSELASPLYHCSLVHIAGQEAGDSSQVSGQGSTSGGRKEMKMDEKWIPSMPIASWKNWTSRGKEFEKSAWKSARVSSSASECHDRAATFPWSSGLLYQNQSSRRHGFNSCDTACRQARRQG